MTSRGITSDASATPAPVASRRRAGASTRDDAALDRLIVELRLRGVTFLTGGNDQEIERRIRAHPLPTGILLRRLAACREPSVRDATIALLLLHPDLAQALPPTIAHPRSTAMPETLATLYLAALYLQRMWRSRLTLALGETEPLPSHYWRERGLPDPDVAAAAGLWALAARERRRVGAPFNYLAMWQQQVDQLVSQGWRARRRAAATISPPPSELVGPAWAPLEGDAASGWLGLRHTPRGANAMSMRAPADRERIERFLERLGGLAHESARLYLVGGTTMVYEGFRATTADVDLLVEASDPGPLVSAIRSLKDALDMNVEFASPRDFIPLPAGWRERSAYIGRYGPLDVFHFDLYSMALSKIERGAERDFNDVVSLVRGGRIDLAQLDAFFAEILPRVATEGLAGMDPDVFTEHFEYLHTLLSSTA